MHCEECTDMHNAVLCFFLSNTVNQEHMKKNGE